MDTRNLFKHGKKISAKLFRRDYRKSKPTQELLQNENISKILDRDSERRELNQKMHEKSKGGLSRHAMQETIGEMKTLNESEKHRLAKEIFPNLPSGQRIIRPKASKPPVPVRVRTLKTKGEEASVISENSQKNPVKMAVAINRIRQNAENSPTEDSDSGNKKSFFNALAATTKNKR